MKSMNIIIIGVGGQGSLLASRVLGNLGMELGMEVKVSEVHGMSQRGGSVVTYVRMGESIASPLIDNGEADTVLAFEQLEGARALPFLRKGGTMIVNTQKISPMSVINGTMEYPSDIEAQLLAHSGKLTMVDALSLAQQAGNTKCVNIVMLGVMAKHADIAKETWLKVLEKTIPSKLLTVNSKAFELGYEY